jgi:type II secretory pathway pseudopilin PulG
MMNAQLPSSSRGRRPEAAFTMVEIALCIAIIGFALVAIIGVLPTGLRVQSDNRDDTVIGQDAAIFMEAIRSGGQGANLGLIGQFADRVNVGGTPYGLAVANPGRRVIGLLCNTNFPTNYVDMRAISGVLADQGTNQITSFRYRLYCQVTNAPVLSPAVAGSLYEVRLTFRWPLLPNGGVGSGRRTYRTLVTGDLVRQGTTPQLFFLEPQVRTNSL